MLSDIQPTSLRGGRGWSRAVSDAVGLVGGLSGRGLGLPGLSGGSGVVGGRSRRGLDLRVVGRVGGGRWPIQAWPGSTRCRAGLGWSVGYPGVAWVYALSGGSGVVGGLSRHGLDLRVVGRVGGGRRPIQAWPGSTRLAGRSVTDPGIPWIDHRPKTTAHTPKPTAEAAISGSATPCVAGQTMTKMSVAGQTMTKRCVAGQTTPKPSNTPPCSGRTPSGHTATRSCHH